MREAHYKEYREVKAVERMTAVLLYDLTHKERLLADYVRCGEPDGSGAHVCVGFFDANGLRVHVADDALEDNKLGRALVGKG